MLAILSRKPIDIKCLLAFRQLAEKGKVAKGRQPGHSDGWGIVAYVNGLPRYLGREPTNALSDNRYEKACDIVELERISGILFCQLRKRSVGRRNVHNTPPIIKDRFCYMHNGTVQNLGNRNESDSIQLL